MWWIGILVVIALIALWAIGVYNRLVRLKEMVKNATGQIAAQIESRWDALKSLIDATKSYTGHEADVLKSIAESRAKIGSGTSVKDIEADNEKFESALGRLIAIGESYPDLKASEVYQTTMGNIDKYEMALKNSRMIYNDTVTRYNREIKVFPAVIIAGFLGFREEEYFKSSESKQEMPTW